jgi:hypothetical protein
MAIPDAPPDPTYDRVVLSDPEGTDSADLTRLLGQALIENQESFLVTKRGLDLALKH